MSEIGLTMIFFSGIVVVGFLLSGLANLLGKVLDKRYENKREKIESENPEFMRLWNQALDFREEKIYKYDKTFSTIKTQIDNITKELPYLPEEDKMLKTMELEKLKHDYVKYKFILKKNREEFIHMAEVLNEKVKLIPDMEKFHNPVFF